MKFIFGGDTGETPESIARKREYANMIMGRQRAPKDVGEGLHAIGQALIARGMVTDADKAQQAGMAGANDLRDQFASLISGSSAAFPPAPSSDGGGGLSSFAGSEPMDPASQRVAQSHGDNSNSQLPQSFLSAVDRTEGAGAYDTLYGHAQRKGPFAGTNVSQMTIGDALAFSAPTGAYGQHVKGQIGRVATPMGRHQIVGTTLRKATNEMGLDPSTPFNAQTQDAVAAHLARQRIASANTMDGKINALRSEWQGFQSVPRPQMEQIVRDLETSPSRPQNAVQANEAMANGTLQGGLTPDSLQQWAQTNYGQPVGVAENENDVLALEQAMAQQAPHAFQSQGMMPAASGASPRLQQPQPQMQKQAQPQQPMPMQPQQPQRLEMSGNTDVPFKSAPDMQMLMSVLQSPFMDEGTKSVASTMLQQQLQNQDPMHQLNMDYKREQLNQLRNPQPDLTTGQREYQMAMQQGYQGSFMDYKRDLAEAQRAQTNVTTNVNGGEGAPGLGKLSADYGYILDPETRQPVIDPNTGLPQAAPVPGSPAARAIADEKAKADAARRNAGDYAHTVTQDVGIADNYLKGLEGVYAADGIVGANLRVQRSKLPGTPEYNMKQFVDSALSNVTLDTMNRMRETSAAGATGMGNMSDKQLKVIQGVLGQWDPGLPVKDQQMILHRLGNFYMDVQFGSKSERMEAVRNGSMSQEESDAIQSLYYPETRDVRGNQMQEQGKKKPISEMTDEELEALIQGQ